MAQVQIDITNNESDAITLPDELGGNDIAASATETLLVETRKFRRLKHNNPSTYVQALEQVNEQWNVTVAISAADEPPHEVEDFEEELERAATKAAVEANNVREGVAAVSTTTTSVTFGTELPDANYDVMLTPQGDPAPSSGPQYWYVTNKSSTGFDIEMNQAPSAEFDMAYSAKR